jgi:hypothetical protein
MIRLLADHNITRQCVLIWNVFDSNDWHALGVAAMLQFADIYREDCAYRIADIATRIEQLYGTARLFIP